MIRSHHPSHLSHSWAESDLFRREVDLAFRFRPEGVRPTPDALLAQKLGDEPFRLYGAPTYLGSRGVPEDPNALRGHDVVHCSLRHPAAAWCASAFRDANVVLTSPSLQLTGAAVAASAGLGVMPERAARQWPELRALSPVVAQGTGWLLTHPNLRRVRRIRIVADTLAALFRASAPGDHWIGGRTRIAGG
jgi:DNA-binding transcriptional LysR family regulator